MFHQYLTCSKSLCYIYAKHCYLCVCNNIDILFAHSLVSFWLKSTRSYDTNIIVIFNFVHAKIIWKKILSHEILCSSSFYCKVSLSANIFEYNFKEQQFLSITYKHENSNEKFTTHFIKFMYIYVYILFSFMNKF